MDTRTVIIVMLAQVSLLGVLALVFGARQRGTRAVSAWGAGLFLVGAGYAGLAMRDVLPALLSITVVNTLLMAASLLFYRSVRIFMGRPVHDPLGVAALAATAVLLFVFSEISPNLQVRILVVSAIGAALFARNAMELRSDVPREVQPSHRFMQGVYWIVSALLLARFAATLLQPGTSLMDPSASESAFFLGVLLVATAGTFGNFWIEAQHLHLELARQAARDSLTGILNRGAFFDALEREMARARRGGGVLSVAMFDLDHFKRINDAHGHPAGDEVLRRVAASMEASIRQPDILGRYGGEEFALLMPDTDADMAMSVAERIRAKVQSKGVEWKGQRLSVAVSGGVAAFPGNGMTADGIVATADAALYDAKHAGRNRVLRSAGRAVTPDSPNGMHARS